MTIKQLIPKLKRGPETLPAQRAATEPIRSFQRELNRLFDDFFSDFHLAPAWGWTEGVPVEFNPRIDVSETDQDVRVSAELPGLDEKDITVEIDDTAITLRGEKRAEKEDQGRNWYTREQTYGSFHRMIRLPASVAGEQAVAKFKKGLLTITVPKRPEAQERRKTIKIETD